MRCHIEKRGPILDTTITEYSTMIDEKRTYIDGYIRRSTVQGDDTRLITNRTLEHHDIRCIVNGQVTSTAKGIQLRS